MTLIKKEILETREIKCIEHADTKAFSIIHKINNAINSFYQKIGLSKRSELISKIKTTSKNREQLETILKIIGGDREKLYLFFKISSLESFEILEEVTTCDKIRNNKKMLKLSFQIAKIKGVEGIRTIRANLVGINSNSEHDIAITQQLLKNIKRQARVKSPQNKNKV